MNAPKITLTRRQKVEEREKAILASARDVFVRKGYDGARMTEIAAGANIAEGTVYIYYKNKAALMRALVGYFWENLIADAWEQIADTQGAIDALTKLARFHITALMEQSDMIDLTHSLRANSDAVGTTADELKAYVKVFDTLYTKGVDRGELKPHSELWIARDVFYGTLDYSARTLLLHDDKNIEPVVANLIASIQSQFAVRQADSKGASTSMDSLLDRLETVCDKLEQSAKGQS